MSPSLLENCSIELFLARQVRKYNMGSKSETLRAPLYFFEYSVYKHHPFSRSASTRICFAREKSTRNFRFEQDFDNMSLEQHEFLFLVTA